MFSSVNRVFNYNCIQVEYNSLIFNEINIDLIMIGLLNFIVGKNMFMFKKNPLCLHLIIVDNHPKPGGYVYPHLFVLGDTKAMRSFCLIFFLYEKFLC